MALFEQGSLDTNLYWKFYTCLKKLIKKNAEIIIWHICCIYKVFRELKALSYGIIILKKKKKLLRKKMGVKVEILFFMFTKSSFLVFIFPASSLIFSKQQDSKLTNWNIPKQKWLKMCDLSLKGMQQSGKRRMCLWSAISVISAMFQRFFFFPNFYFVW